MYYYKCLYCTFTNILTFFISVDNFFQASLISEKYRLWACISGVTSWSYNLQVNSKYKLLYSSYALYSLLFPATYSCIQLFVYICIGFFFFQVNPHPSNLNFWQESIFWKIECKGPLLVKMTALIVLPILFGPLLSLLLIWFLHISISDSFSL